MVCITMQPTSAFLDITKVADFRSKQWQRIKLETKPKRLFNLFEGNVPILKPPENNRKPMVFWCFQLVQDGSIGLKNLAY